MVSAALHLIDAGLGAIAPDTGPLPNQSPILWTLLAFARRQFDTAMIAPAAAASPSMSTNLLVNPGAETADPSGSGYSSVTVPGWTVTGTPTVIAYGTPRGYPSPLESPIPFLPTILGFLGLGFPSTAPAGGGSNFFGGGPVATSSISQTVDLSTSQALIDAGATPYTLSGDFGGYFLDPSSASVKVTFLDANQGYLGTGATGAVSVLDRLGFTGFQTRETSGIIPVGTRYAQETVTFNDANLAIGNYNDAFADNLSFTVGDASLAPATLTPPTSTVGELDHVFVIYMENKGYGNIVGSPNAPYVNSLIDAYGVADDYYALGHPSDPNYQRVLGGTDFGVDYNCKADCFDAPSLMESMDNAGVSWAGYAQAMPFPGAIESSGDYSVEELRMLAFKYVYDNTTEYQQKHLLPLTQLEDDLADYHDNPFPNFTWVVANQASDMEGATGFPFGGFFSWLASQLTDHQYDIATGDKFLQEQMSIIMNSEMWKDESQKSAIFLTWDEDFNNLSLGVGNEGNHVPMIVIPSVGAVKNGNMREGHFVASNNYNHYSLMRTIEESLRLPAKNQMPLTNNDKYAQPMNEFWWV